MGYHIRLSRPEPGPGITAREWRDFVATRPELEIVDENAGFITAVLDGDENLALHYSKGCSDVFTKNPEGPRLIAYMVSIAPHFGAAVTGDEGEVYATEADCGSDIDWNAPLRKAPWWKRELRELKGVMFTMLVVIILRQILHLCGVRGP